MYAFGLFMIVNEESYGFGPVIGQKRHFEDVTLGSGNFYIL